MVWVFRLSLVFLIPVAGGGIFHPELPQPAGYEEPGSVFRMDIGDEKGEIFLGDLRYCASGEKPPDGKFPVDTDR